MTLGETDFAVRQREGRLALEQLGLALRALAPNFWLMPILAFVVCLIFSRWIGAFRLSLFFAAVALGGLPLAIVSHLFQRRMPAAEEARLWVRRCCAAYLVFALAWASMSFLLWAPGGDDLNHLLIVMLLACTIAGNGALIGASKPLSLVAYATYGPALILAPLQQGDFIYSGLAVLATLYLGYLIYMSQQIYRTARDMLCLRFEKNDLIVALAASKAESDQARKRAEAASVAKSQFLANMSHELRTPLNAILGFSEIISSGVFKTDAARHVEYADLINDSGRHLLALINDILDLAKIEAGRFELREADIDLARLIEDTVHLMTLKAREAGVMLDIEMARAIPCVHADERAMKQVMLNLLSNAVKFTPAGGRVTAFARLEEAGIFFGVADSGVGIAKDDQLRIFENFGQGRHDVVTSDKGTGLGLPIVKGLLEAHQGGLRLESEPGHGTRVTAFLPRARLRPPALKAAS